MCTQGDHEQVAHGLDTLHAHALVPSSFALAAFKKLGVPATFGLSSLGLEGRKAGPLEATEMF